MSAHAWHFGISNQDFLIQVEFLTVRVSKSNLREQELGLHPKHFVPELEVSRSAILLFIVGKVLRARVPRGQPWQQAPMHHNVSL